MQTNKQPQLILNNHSFHLPKEQTEKINLYQHIQGYIGVLMKRQQQNRDKILTLELRKRLIKNHGLSVERIQNLETIFMYYCSHIFKTGKHMTFQRLQYEKSHLTMDRFFVFLKDFQLITANIDGQIKEIIEKPQLILLFKKISINAKDLDFQQFISLLDRIGLIYYDCMTNYNSRQKKFNQQRKKRRQNYIKSMKKRQAALQAIKRSMNSNEFNEQNQDKLTSHNELQKRQENPAEQQQFKAENNIMPVQSPAIVQNQSEIKQPALKLKVQSNDKNIIPNNETNDNFITELINDKNIQDPNDLIDNQIQKLKQQQLKQQMLPDALIEMMVQQLIPEGKQEPQIQEEDKQYLLKLTPQEKIQYFYQIINVDNATAFKKKMREINLPIFQVRHKRVQSNIESKFVVPKGQPIIRRSKRNNTSVNQEQFDQKQRLQQFRTKYQQKKEKDKLKSPQMNKQQYERRKKDRMQHEINAATPAKRQFSKKRKIEIVQLQTDLSSLNKIPFDEINFKKFNPQKLIQSNQQDDKYLQQYSSNLNDKVERSQKRIEASFQVNEGKSLLMLERLKKRTQQMQQFEKNQQLKLNTGPRASFQHQMRKNKLVQKLLKIHKQ